MNYVKSIIHGDSLHRCLCSIASGVSQNLFLATRVFFTVFLFLSHFVRSFTLMLQCGTTVAAFYQCFWSIRIFRNFPGFWFCLYLLLFYSFSLTFQRWHVFLPFLKNNKIFTCLSIVVIFFYTLTWFELKIWTRLLTRAFSQSASNLISSVVYGVCGHAQILNLTQLKLKMETKMWEWISKK
jgi:hypothetical protein